MIERQLIKYTDFEIEFKNAIDKKNLSEFVLRLQDLIEKKLNIYFSHLFLARSYFALQEIDLAKENYLKAFSIAKNPDWIKNEILLFAEKNKISISFNESKIIVHEKLDTSKILNIKPNASKEEIVKYFRDASNFTKNGELDKAIDIYRGMYKLLHKEENFINTYIIALQRNKLYDEAEQIINKSIKETNNQEILSKFLLRKAQLLTAAEKYSGAEATYLQLIKLNRNRSFVNKQNNLSHLLHELARIQAAHTGNITEAIKNAEESVKFNPQNNLAEKLLNSISKHKENRNKELDFIIEEEEQIDYVSPMLKIDIDEFEYRDSEILKLGGIPTPDIANRLLQNANDTEKQQSDSYIKFIEAAKAFNDCKKGTYTLTDFYQALASYALLKGNSLYNLYINSLSRNDYTVLGRLKDSACSYYIESLNLQNLIGEQNFLVGISNYIKLQVSFTAINNDISLSSVFFEKEFSYVLDFCLYHREHIIQNIAYTTVVSCGAASFSVWNKLANIPGGTSSLYGILRSSKKQKEVYSKISKIESLNFETKLKPSEFFKKVFNARQNKVKQLQIAGRKLIEFDFIPKNINDIKAYWTPIKSYSLLLNDTDNEIIEIIDYIIKLYEPYLFRISEERTRIIYDVRTALDKQLNFIIDNTTFWGRVIFYPLIKKWRVDIDNFEKSRFDQTLPKIIVKIDPNTIQQGDENFYLQLLLKNEGAATSEGFHLTYNILNIISKQNKKGEIAVKNEIAVNSAYSAKIEIEKEFLVNNSAINFHSEVTPFYQELSLPSITFETTIEKDEEFNLTTLDIPWNESSIPRKELFKGRDVIINELVQHYKSFQKNKTYILYGLTRTGKSSIIKYLSERLDEEYLFSNGVKKKIVSFVWDFSKATAESSAKDMWSFLLETHTINKLRKLIAKQLFDNSHLPYIKNDNNIRFRDWRMIIEHLNEFNYYPIFLIDEFSYYKFLIDKSRLDQSFLASIRQFALEESASFLFAGTYDLKELIADASYGFTGQFVNTIEKPISKIDVDSAKELINAAKDKLVFTDDAIEHILFLSNRIPYFIQIICLYSGVYAVENKKKHIGYPEVEHVVKILSGELSKSENSSINDLPVGIFHNNQFNPTDNQVIPALLSSICYFNQGKLKPRGVSNAELQKFWGENKIEGFRQKLAQSIQYLRDKEILIEEKDEGMPVYKIGVDLFRRWWERHHPDIELELDSLK